MWLIKYLRGQRDPPRHPPAKPRGYFIDKDQADSHQRKANCPSAHGTWHQKPTEGPFLCGLESPLHALQELNPMFSSPSLFPHLLKAHPTLTASASCTQCISKLPENISSSRKRRSLCTYNTYLESAKTCKRIWTWSACSTQFVSSLCRDCSQPQRPDPEPKVHTNLQLNPQAVPVLQCTTVSPHIMLESPKTLRSHPWNGTVVFGRPQPAPRAHGVAVLPQKRQRHTQSWPTFGLRICPAGLKAFAFHTPQECCND